MKKHKHVKLGEIIEPRREKALPKKFPELPFIGLEQVEAHTMKLLGTVPATAMRSTSNRFYAGDLLYGRLRPYLNKICKPTFDGLCSTEFIVLPKTEGIDLNFLKYRLNARDFVSFATHLNAGDRPRVDFDQISSFDFFLPSYLDQRRIVAKIEELFSDLDKGIANLQTAREQLKVYRQALLKHAFEGKLTAQWREKNKDKLETTEALLQRIQNERARRYQQQLADWEANNKQGSKPKPPKILPPLTKEELAELPVLPKGWAWEKVGNISFLVTDGTHLKPQYTNSGVPFLSVKNVRPGKILDLDIKYISQEQHASYINRCKPETKDILYTKVGATYGYAAINNLEYEFSIYVSLCLIKYPHRLILPKFFEACLNSNLIYKQAQNRVKGIGRPDLHLEEIQEFYFPICSQLEQDQIAQQIESRLSVVDQLEQTITTSLQQAETLRQSILKKAFSGQLVPQDPNDEPASVLLARIQAEKAAQSCEKERT
jgi:type I restriction enzyme S subunit